MGKAYERWELWTKKDGRAAFWDWCDKQDHLSRLEAMGDEVEAERAELRKLLADPQSKAPSSSSSS